MTAPFSMFAFIPSSFRRIIGLACWLTLAYVAGWISHILWRQTGPVVERMVGAYVEGRPTPAFSRVLMRDASVKRGGGSVKC